MRGLRTKEEDKFIKFFQEIQNQATQENKVFFMDSGECKDIPFKDMILDELSGWLIPIERADTFENKFKNNESLDTFIDFYLWVIPEIMNNELVINFKSF